MDPIERRILHLQYGIEQREGFLISALDSQRPRLEQEIWQAKLEIDRLKRGREKERFFPGREKS